MIIEEKEKTLDCLLEVRKLIEDGWTQCGYAKNDFGYEVSPSSPEATKFCLLGAISRVCGEKDYSYSIFLSLISKAISFYGYSPTPIAIWNDDGSRVKQDIINVIDIAIERYK